MQYILLSLALLMPNFSFAAAGESRSEKFIDTVFVYWTNGSVLRVTELTYYEKCLEIIETQYLDSRLEAESDLQRHCNKAVK